MIFTPVHVIYKQRYLRNVCNKHNEAMHNSFYPENFPNKKYEFWIFLYTGKLILYSLCYSLLYHTFEVCNKN